MGFISSRGILLGCVSLSGLLAGFACGGTATNLPGNGDGGTASSSSGSSGAGSSGGGSSGAGSSSGSASSSGAGSSSGNGSSSGAGSSGASSGVGTGDAGATTIACGAATCSLPSQLCCVTQAGGGGGGGFTYACVSGSTCPTSGGGGNPPVGLQCTSTEACATGDVCCFDGTTNTATCAPTCNGNNTTQLCDPNAASSGCPQGQPCQAGGVDGLPQSQGTCGGG
ncbi:MAG: hypothetical protein ACRELB_24265 [Polyangiaceae bacterium]